MLRPLKARMILEKEMQISSSYVLGNQFCKGNNTCLADALPTSILCFLHFQSFGCEATYIDMQINIAFPGNLKTVYTT